MPARPFVPILAAGLALALASPVVADAPSLLLLDAQHLASVAARAAAGDARAMRAVAAVEDAAQRALRVAPVSVMDKATVPPSGDKHDYMSRGPYWWPDPARPGGLPYIRRDGERNPEIDAISDHANFTRVIDAVAALGPAYRLTGKEPYAAHAARLLRTWFLDEATRMNPHLQYGQAIPGITEGRGIGIIETRQLPTLLDGALLISGAAAWTPADEQGLRRWMRDYLTWLVESPHGRDEAKNGNNHETWYDVQVAGLAFYTGQDALARRTLEGVKARIATQIEPDGRQPEELARTRTWGYSVMNLQAFFNLARLGERAGVDLWHYRTADGRGLRGALDFLAGHADGTRPWPYPQIVARDPDGIQELLLRGASAWQAPVYADLAARLGPVDPRLDVLVK